MSYLSETGLFVNDLGSLDPPDAGEEIPTLIGFLERQRATFAWKCAGLDEAGLGAAVGDSSMTLGGLLKHLARFEDDMATEWLHGQRQRAPWNAVDWDADRNWDWRTAAAESQQELYGRWRDAVVRSRASFAEALESRAPHSRAAPPAGLSFDLPTLRYILINMIEEYARHNGHADLIRESVDGLVGHDPPA